MFQTEGKFKENGGGCRSETLLYCLSFSLYALIPKFCTIVLHWDAVKGELLDLA